VCGVNKIPDRSVVDSTCLEDLKWDNLLDL
jgi:hypothetical protein